MTMCRITRTLRIIESTDPNRRMASHTHESKKLGIINSSRHARPWPTYDRYLPLRIRKSELSGAKSHGTGVEPRPAPQLMLLPILFNQHQCAGLNKGDVTQARICAGRKTSGPCSTEMRKTEAPSVSSETDPRGRRNPITRPLAAYSITHSRNVNLSRHTVGCGVRTKGDGCRRGDTAKSVQH